MPPPRVVVVGAGHAGGAVASFLRQCGFAGSILLIGAEPSLPYERPPLSKAWLTGQAAAADLLLKPAQFYREQAVDVLLRRTVAAIDRTARTVRLDDGRTIGYDRLVLATGAGARQTTVAGHDLQNVLYLRDQADAEKLKAALRPARRIVICGGGYIGLEVAAAARGLGVEVTVVEQQQRLLSRVASAPLASFYLRKHLEHGVEFRLGTAATSFVGHHGAVAGVTLASGETLPCDAVLVGIGAVPRDGLAHRAGLDCRDGIVVDGAARTSDPQIFAIGDVTYRPVPLYGRSFRIESVPNVVEQAKQAAAAIAERPAPRAETPWFWSDQYATKLQIAGLACDTDALVVRGDAQRGPFAVFHLRGDRLLAVEAIDSPAEFLMGKKLIAKRRPVRVDRLGDPDVPMADIAA